MTGRAIEPPSGEPRNASSGALRLFDDDGQTSRSLNRDEIAAKLRELKRGGRRTGPATPAQPSQTLPDLERELRSRLWGARLVLEAGIDRVLDARVRAEMRMLLDAGFTRRSLQARTPATLVTYLVSVGVFDYEGGDFWPHVDARLQGQNDVPREEFVESLKRLGLETFDELVANENAHRFVSRILAHGGVPMSCVAPMAQLLANEIRQGAVDAADLMAGWRVRREKLDSLHAPTARFLLYGGPTAVDLIDRSIDLLRAPRGEGHGLPPHVAEAMRETAGRAPAVSTRSQARLPRAVMRLDPYACLGPSITLPAVASTSRDGSWRVDNGSTIVRRAASAFTDVEVRLTPAHSYQVEFDLADGHRRVSTLESVSDDCPAFLFSARDGRKLRRAERAREEVLALLPPEFSIRLRIQDGSLISPHEIEELPSPTGAWAGWQAVHLDLADATALEIHDRDLAKATVSIATHDGPVVHPAPVEGVRTASGLPVVSETPKVLLPPSHGEQSWTIEVTCGDALRHVEVVAPSGKEVPLADLIPAELCEFHVRVRGPLGSDIRTELALVPGLRLHGLDHLILPGETRTAWGRGEGITVDGTPATEWTAFEVPEAALVAPLAVALDGRTLELLVDVPRLAWTLHHDTKPATAPGVTAVRVGKEEFEDQLADVLVVRTGRPGDPLKAEVRHRSTSLGVQLEGETAGPEGRWAFDLAPLAEDIRRADAGRLEIWLQASGAWTRAADVLAAVEITELDATSRCVDGACQATITARLARAMDGVVVRLWSNERPWADPVEAPLDPQSGVAWFPLTDELPPGSYVAEVAIADPWIRPARQNVALAASRRVLLGTRDEFDAHLLGLDSGDGHTALTRAAAGWPMNPMLLDPALIDSVAVDALIGASALLSEVPRASGGVPGRIGGLLDTASCRDAILARGLVSAIEDEELSRADALRLQLRLLQRLEPVTDPVEPALLDRLWRTCPLIAGALEIPWAAIDPGAADRCRRYLGWSTGEPLEEDGGAIDQAFVAMPEDQLVGLRRLLYLAPGPLLDPSQLQRANFDWLEARCRGDAPAAWFTRYAWLMDALEGDVDPRITAAAGRYLDARQVKGAEAIAGLPLSVLGAALHAIDGHRARNGAVAALDEALEFAPALVVHDLLLVMTLRAVARGEDGE